MWKKEIKIIAAYILFLVTAVIVICQKENFHIDEIFSYGLANCQTSTKLDFVDGFLYDSPQEPWMDYMTVDEASRFDYGKVWKNQAEDVHPPLYYAILHAICSFFPGKFSVWFAGSINIVFGLLTLYMVRRLIRKLTDKEEAVFAVSLIFAFSPGILNAVSFLRMYVMVMFEVAWITCWFLDALEKPKLTIKSCFTLLVISVMGTMTHYYFVVYLFFLCLVFGLYLLWNRRGKELALFVGNMALAGGIAVCLFPAMLEHIFSGYRGEESFSNLTKGGWSDYLGRLKSFWGFLNQQLFGGCLAYLLVALIVCIAAGYFIARSQNRSCCLQEERPCKEKIKEKSRQWVMLIVPSVCYFFLVSKVAVYVIDRYIFPIYAVCLVTVFCGLLLIVTKYVKGKFGWFICGLLCVMIAGNGWRVSEWQYLYNDFGEFLDKSKEYSDLDCIVVYDNNKWKLQTNFYEIRNYKSVTFVSIDDWSTLDNLSLRDVEEAIVITIGNHEANLDAVLCRAPLLNAYEVVGQYAYSVTYHVYGQDLQVESYQIWDYEHERQIGWEIMDKGLTNVCMSTEDSEVLYIDNLTSEEDCLWMANKVFDIQDGSFAEGTNVLLYTANHGMNQMWSIYRNADGSASILAADERFALTRDENGNVKISEYVSGKLEQKWWLE